MHGSAPDRFYDILLGHHPRRYAPSQITATKKLDMATAIFTEYNTK